MKRLVLIDGSSYLSDREAAESVKRHPLAKVESFFHVRHEDGTVQFFTEPLPPVYGPKRRVGTWAEIFLVSFGVFSARHLMLMLDWRQTRRTSYLHWRSWSLYQALSRCRGQEFL